MYLDHFGFEREPFNITPDSRFLFSSRRHSEAMASLLYGIEQRKGFIALTGEIGAGKTTTCRALLKELDRSDIRLALIFNPQLNDLELLQAICKEYGIPAATGSKRELLDLLNAFLISQYELGNNCVLVIDESQRLSPDALEQVRLISNLELETTKLIQIALVGQPELDDMLHLPELEQLNQRITVRCHIDPLDYEEMCEYIRHRLQIAGGKGDLPFGKKALKLVYGFSGGTPRKINVLCDRVLLVAFVEGAHEIDESHVRKALVEVQGRRARKPTAAGPDSVAGEHDDTGDPEPAKEGGGAKLLVAALLVAAIVAVSAIMTSGDKASPPPASAASPSPSPTPAPSPVDPEPVPDVEVAVVAPAETPVPTPTPAATPPAPALPWTYDSDGVLRVENPGVAFAASVLTWVNLALGDRLGDDDLAQLAAMDSGEIAGLKLTEGKPPLHLRSAELPASPALLSADLLPALVQIDAYSKDFGPWAVVVGRDEASFALADPIRGILDVSADELASHLAGVVVPYSDPAAITDLMPNDEGDRVRALQRLLSKAGVYEGPATGAFDDRTLQAVLAFRKRESIPGDTRIDAMLALVLLSETGQDGSTP